ncbi:MAG TPA: hypothetical protein VFM29_05775 [Vicinamibacteria bacterium]|nr:hypothetical protein [Vicinamibacteria bacterium]
MKTGYTEAAWRLFDPALAPRSPSRHPREVTWADAELAGTPFVSRPLPLPLVRARGSH